MSRSAPPQPFPASSPWPDWTGEGRASVDSSSQGISIGVAAPAEDLIGGMPGGGYAEWAGTSGATPIVAGVAALIRSKWPEMSAKQVINRIVSTAKDAGAPGQGPALRLRHPQRRGRAQGGRTRDHSQPAGLDVGLDPGPPPRRTSRARAAPAAVPAASAAAPTLPEPTVPVARGAVAAGRRHTRRRRDRVRHAPARASWRRGASSCDGPSRNPPATCRRSRHGSPSRGWIQHYAGQ